MYAILALCLLGLVAAQAPVPCTTPPQWEATVFEINEQQRLMIRGRFSYDAVYHREHIIEEVDVGRSDDTYEVVTLFDLNIEYIYDFKARTCTHRQLNRPWRNFSIPLNAQSLGEVYVGTSAVPGAGILSTIWSGNQTRPGNDTVRTFGTWTYQACLPVRFIDHSTRFGRTEISFFDITPGISNPSVFIPRRECLTQEEYAKRDVLFAPTPKKIHE